MAFQMENVSFSYGGSQVLRGIDLTIEPGRFYGILGPNGCGKTTFLDLLVRHREPDTGRIFLGNREMARISRKELAKKTALVSQDYYIDFPYTAQEVVMMGRHPYIPRFASPGEKDFQVVEQVMRITGVERFKDRHITELSGGERQRTVFARALAQDTEVLVLDEATSNLDISHTLGLLDIVRERVSQNGLTVVSVFQDINMAAVYCDEIIYMKAGKVQAFGKTGDMMEPHLLEKIFNVRSTVRFEPLYNARQAVFKTGEGMR